MRLSERRCECCQLPIDPVLTSAHHARVVWLCTEHGRRFHAVEFLWRASSTAEALARIELWLKLHALPAANDVTARAA